MFEKRSISSDIDHTITGRLKTTPYDIFKRGMDIIVSTIGLLVLGPFFLYLSWLIRRDTPGPALFRSPRVGRDGRIFQIMKFRTMYEYPESYAGSKVTAQDDPRITTLGKWLRDTKLNELPQLWNVLKGEMSLVGPRPEDPDIVSGWSDETRNELLSVRPGVTSPASVVYRDEEKLMTIERALTTYLEEIMPSKHRLDQLYVRNRSLWSDLDVIIWTVLPMVPRVKTEVPTDSLLFTGPIWRLMRRYANWFVIDMLVTFIAFALAGVVWRSLGPLNIGLLRAVVLAIGFAVLYSLVGALSGMQKVAWSKATAEDAWLIIPPVAVATLVALLVNHLIHVDVPGLPEGVYWSTENLIPDVIIIIAAVLAFSGFLIVRFRSRLATGLAMRWVKWRGSPTTGERVLLIGGGETGQFAAWLLQNGRYASSMRVVGIVDDDLFKQGVRIGGVDVVGQIKDIPKIVARYDVGIIVFAIHNIKARERRKLLRQCASTSANCLVFPDIHAALQQIRRDGNGGKVQNGASHLSKSSRRDSAADILPCEICLTKVSPMRMDDWLSKLEKLALQGELELLEEEIAEYRRRLRGDVQTQLAANLGVKPR